MGRKSKKVKKEDIAEDCCFACKDGGLLMVCDYKDCLKAYHPQCAEKDDLFLKSEERWRCKWHCCFICKNTAKFYCFCCPKAVCGRCLCDTTFVVSRGMRGFCSHCLTIIGFIEGFKVSEFDLETIDFNDQGTYEFLFKCYWKFIKQKENISRSHIRSAIELLKMGKNCRRDSDSNVSDFEAENPFVSDNDSLNDSEQDEMVRIMGRNELKKNLTKKLPTSRKWGSRALLDFLASIGKDATARKYSLYDVADIITGYCQKNMLFHQEKKKKIICDSKLQSLLGKKSANKSSLCNLLAIHFLDNFEQDKDLNVPTTFKRQRISSPNGKKDVIFDLKKCSYVSINSSNIKLVYLKRSLVVELLKEPWSFVSKVTGSFVRIKFDPHDGFKRNSHQLSQVTGIKNVSSNGDVESDTVLLQTLSMPQGVPFFELSDEDFSEEECMELCQLVKDGLIKRPTMMEFMEKARCLHEILTKSWIAKETILLRSVIKQAGDNGWKRELSGSIDRLLRLEKPEEQLRLLCEIPRVIAEEDDEFDHACQSTVVAGFSDEKLADTPPEGSGEKQTISADRQTVKEKPEQPEEQLRSSCEIPHNEFDDACESTVVAGFSDRKLADTPPEGSGEKQTISSDRQPVKEKQTTVQPVELIELSDDEEDEENKEPLSMLQSQNQSESQSVSLWYCMSPHGFQCGPYSLSVLKEWNDSSSGELKFKVWKMGQSFEDSVSVQDAIRLFSFSTI